MSVLKAFAFMGIVGSLFTSPALANNSARACDDPAILKSITSRFLRQSVAVHDADLRIDGFARVHQHRHYEKTALSHYARRYCGATATLSDGRKREVWYLIESNAGLVGLGNNIEFCVSGFDRWNVYNASCRVLR